jgi:hypothetical protein
MQSIRKLYDGDSAAQHAHATDRFARKIEGILVLSRAARLRRLMRNPLGGNQPYPVADARLFESARPSCTAILVLLPSYSYNLIVKDKHGVMDEQRFWTLIVRAWPPIEQAMTFRQMAFTGELQDSDDFYRIQKLMLANLTDLLSKLDADELLTFDRILERKLYDIDRADIQEYTDGSDDGFLYCRGFIVSMGQEYYDLVKTDPSHALLDVEFEEFCYHPRWLYQEKYGPMPPSDISRETGSNASGWAE